MDDETHRIDRPSAPPPRDHRALAALAFGAVSDSTEHDPHRSAARHLAILPPDALDLDLTDPDQRAFGEYELLEKLGQGGMGVVYRARQRSLDREVAIKLLAAGPWASADFIERFRREAQSAARMQHPNIVAIFEIGAQEDLNYFSMQLVRGPTLAQVLGRQGVPAPREAARLMRILAEAVDYAHRLGVLHLDLKPGNVLMTDRDEPKIADFGLARRLDETLSADSDEISGTPSYMAPEQAQPHAHKLSPATDIYGLGTILYELLTGRPPHLAPTSQETLRKLLTERPAAPRTLVRDLPLDLDAICLKCLAFAAEDRYASARQLADDLARFLDNRAVSVRRPGTGERIARWVKREPRLAAFAGLLALSLFGGLVLTAIQWQRAEAALLVAQAKSVEAAEQRLLAVQMRSAIDLMAEVFPGAGNEAAMRESARKVIQWLRKRARSSSGGGEQILQAFTEALIAARKEPAANLLIEEIAQQLSDSYRETLVAALEARSDPHSVLAAAILSWHEDAGAAERERALRLLTRVQRAAPGDVLVQYAVALYCAGAAPNDCPGSAALERLSSLAADDASTWLLAAHTSAEGDRSEPPPLSMVASEPRDGSDVLRAALSGAAHATTFDDRLVSLQTLLLQAVSRSGIDVSSELLPTLRTGHGPEAVLDWVGTATAARYVRLLPYQALVDLCRPEVVAKSDPQHGNDCTAVGLLAARAPTSLITNMIGSVVVRRLQRASALETEMIDLRRRYLWLSQSAVSAPLQDSPEDYQRFLADWSREGEMAAMAALARRAGIAPEPPADWTPADPDALLLPEDRSFKVRQ